jgi:hypothetical protein
MGRESANGERIELSVAEDDDEDDDDMGRLSEAKRIVERPADEDDEDADEIEEEDGRETATDVEPTG